MLGVKIKSVKTKNSYTIEGLFDAIKDKEFSAGKPELVKHGLAYIIVFPPIDRQNQIWLMNAGLKKESNKWSIQKQQLAGVGNTAANMALDKVTGGLFGFGGVFGKHVKEAEHLVELTAQELDGMGL